MIAEAVVDRGRAVLVPALSRATVPVAVAFAAAIAASLAVAYIAFLTFADRFLGDWEIAALTAPEPQSRDIVVVAVTEDTLKQFPYRSPIDRHFLAELLKALAARGPRAIGLDILFDQPTEPEKDKELSDTLRSLTVPLKVSYTDNLGLVSDEQRKYLDEFVPLRLRALATLATDQFDTVRWTYPGHTLANGTYLMSFARALAAVVGHDSPAKLVDIAWHGRPSPDVPAFRQYGAELVGALPPEWFKDKIVLIGTDLTLIDRHRTPFSTIYAGDEGMLPGVVIHANSLAQILEGHPPPSIGRWGNFIIVLGCGILGAMLPVFGGTMLIRVGAGAFFLVAFWVAGGVLFRYEGTMIGLIAPTLALAAGHWAMEAVSGREARRQREFITGAFARMVSPKIVQALIADPSRMSLEGERRVMTFFFTDLANFTTLSESLDAHDLSRLVNEYFDGVTEIVLKYDGTISKFEGDAVFAIFNAPVDQPDHAERAVKCALEVDRYAEAFRIEQVSKGRPYDNFGITRIGIHTGEAVVGNFGSRKRFYYSAMGDAVNTAARLEGVNKQFGTHMCVSDATRALCPGIEFRPLSSVVVKGRTKGIVVFEPLHEGHGHDDYLARYGAAFAKLETEAPEALDLFAALYRENPADSCVEMHLSRLKSGKHGAELVLTEK